MSRWIKPIGIQQAGQLLPRRSSTFYFTGRQQLVKQSLRMFGESNGETSQFPTTLWG